ncbi:MAG: hypothetical protein JW820_07485 [Spirochaetales bacterium]|nr:hypothetical protein [Spirochaetales bacterium]
MRKPIARLMLCVCVVAALGSCASIQRSRDDGSVRTVAGLINSGDAEALIAMSEVPFLLDQEIVLLERDVAAFWHAALAAGFRVEEPAVERGERISADSYRQFYDSMEVKTFFNKYLRDNTRLLAFRTRDGQRILLLVGHSCFSRTLHGFKGPF